ncbi:MAG TPA: hydrogenase maturation protein [Gammaproteobacteria bacterium]
MKILLFGSAFNGLCQRVHRELTVMGHSVSFELALNQESMIEAARLFKPDVIICPFLKERVPDRIWQKHICLIVHPGIEGDRGPSALDWAISSNVKEWGVTLLQAAKEMDAGDIWGTGNFTMRTARKASVYRREVTQQAIQLIKQAVTDIRQYKIRPRPLDYTNPRVKGKLMPLMKQQDRQIDWWLDDTETVIGKINAADSFPGLLDEIFEEPAYLFGAKPETKLTGTPGSIIARSSDAYCKATIDGAVWIRMAKRKYGTEKECIKLPANQVLDSVVAGLDHKVFLPPSQSGSYNDIYWHEKRGVGYLYFDFYNGAMNTEQCRRLRQAVRALKKRPVKVIVLMGGEDFWGNGIQLNCIEASGNPAEESWRNIQAMDDLVEEIILSPKHVTLAALRNNAGAGGAIMPLACDKVILRDGIVLNPHYKTMGLYGSEYWTYLLPGRVGESRARKIIDDCLPMLAIEAFSLGVGDELLEESWDNYHEYIVEYAEKLASPKAHRQLLEQKAKRRKADEKSKPLEQYRKEELHFMRESFFDPKSVYHQARYRFVHKKVDPGCVLRVATHRKQSEKQPPALELAPCA